MDRRLPRECLINVAGFLDLREIPALAAVSRRMNDAARDDVVFRAIAERMGLADVAEAAGSDSEPGRRWFGVLRQLLPARREVRAIMHRYERGERRLELRQRQAAVQHQRTVERRRRLRERRLRSIGAADADAGMAPPDAAGTGAE